ncbi:MAG: molybdopterin-binding protein [Beijerinckiaceae bacterium]
MVSRRIGTARHADGDAAARDIGMADETAISASILVIGDEILSGRTKDKNIGYIADYLGQIGIELREVRIVPDVEDEIVAALNALRARYTYVFTTGGIGPTHDDITADSVAKAFGVGISEDPRAIALLLERIKPDDLNAARRRMARIPHGADLIENKISKAPGFIIDNVIVMAGVPSIMQAMLDGVATRLKTGVKMLVETIEAGNLPEGLYAVDLGDIAARHPGVSIGSYPSFVDGRFRNQIVLRGKDAAALMVAVSEARALVDRLANERKSA